MGTPIEPVGEEVQGTIPDQDNSPGPNPAWADVLSILPESFHEAITPHFTKWDQAAQARVEAANSSLKEFESYKPFVEHGITNEELEQGLRLMWEINNNPQNVYSALGSAYNFGQSPGNAAGNAAAVEVDDDEEVTPSGVNNPQVQELQQGLELVSKIVLADAQAKQDAQADMELESELDALKTKHGDYDVRYVLAMMQNGMSGEDAVESFQALKTSFTPKPFAPSVLGNSGGGAGIPSGAIDPTKLSGKDTRSLVAQMIAAANNQP